jgi:putative membrane-bound dehydrogenase-like protein
LHRAPLGNLLNDIPAMKSALTHCVLISASMLGVTTHATEFKFHSQTLIVPDGFEIELVAAPPLVQRPISGAFDEQGRLYVTDSAGMSDKADKQLEAKPHRIVRLDATNADGHFEKSTVFADKMMFPEGCMWRDGSLYVAAPPQIWKLTDTDGDGVADKREIWFDGKTLTGCANDLHGPFAGPDGWIYWCKGAFAKQTYTLANGKEFTTRASHVFRARPDGSGIEPVITGGMDNPVGLAFTSTGERFLTATFLQQPAGGKRDGIIHAIYGGVWGKVHDVIDDHKKTGDLMPVMTQLGPAAPCGIACYRSRIFGDEFRDNLFVCQFNMHKVSRHVLVPGGATFRTQDSDFVSSDNPDFHPTDVIEDADGSLLVVDTGGWYKVCCPTSQLAKPDVLGAIYRVRKKGAPKIDDPRGLKLEWEKMSANELAALLGDERVAVRERAMKVLEKKGADAASSLRDLLQESSSVDARRNAIWTFARIIGDRPIDSEIRLDVYDRLQEENDDSVKLAAMNSVELLIRWGGWGICLKNLEASNPQLRRAAAECLGRLGPQWGISHFLLRATGEKNDRALEHALIFALIEFGGGRPALISAIKSSHPPTQRAALIALDQMDNGGLKPEDVTPLLLSDDAALKQAASWIVGHHADWGGAVAGFFRERLASKSLAENERAELQTQLAQLAHNDAIQDLLADAMQEAKLPLDARLAALRAMAAAGLKETPPRWLAEIPRVLASGDPALVRQAVETTRSFALPKQGDPAVAATLSSAGRATNLPEDIRLSALEALAAMPGGLKSIQPEVFDFLRANIVATKPLATRSAATNALAKAALTTTQLTTLLDAFETVGPLEKPKLLAAFERAPDEEIGLKLVAALKQSPGGLRADQVRSLLSKFPAAVQQQGGQLVEKLDASAAKQKAHLDELAASLNPGDVRRGQAVFQKTGCSQCHAMGYLGGKLGPDLTRIGAVRTERDLLESIVYPSASFVRSYEPMNVVTRSGEQFAGILRKDAPDEVVLATGPETEQHIARADVAEMSSGTVSLMPQGFDQALTRQELADLVAFLKAAK